MGTTGVGVLIVVLTAAELILYNSFYHKKKKKAAMTSLIVSLGILVLFLVTAFPVNVESVKETTYAAKIEERDNGYYVVCDDGSEYRLNAQNFAPLSGFEGHENTKEHKNEKVIMDVRRDYRLWFFLPVHTYSKKTAIYLDGDKFYELFGCRMAE